MTRGFAALTFVTAGLYAALAWVSVTGLLPAAGDLAPFDMRLTGYSVEDARAYLEALSTAGRDLYLGTVRQLDTAFPVVFGAWLAALVWRTARGMMTWSRLVLTLPAWGYAVMDLCENALVADLLRAGAEGFDPQIAVLASEFTVTKYALLVLSALVPVGLWLRGVMRKTGV